MYSVFLGYLAFGRNYTTAFATEGFKEKELSGLRSQQANGGPHLAIKPGGGRNVGLQLECLLTSPPNRSLDIPAPPTAMALLLCDFLS